MIRTNLRVAAGVLAGAAVVLTGCSSPKKAAEPPVVTTTVTAAPESPSPSASESSFDTTLVPASPEPSSSVAISLPASSAPASSAPASSPAASTAPAPSSAASSAPAPGPPIVAGRWFAFLKEVDLGGAGGAGRHVTYDEAQFLTGDAAKNAAAADKAELDNDYYIRNQNTRLRTAPLAPSATALGSIQLTQQVGPVAVPLSAVADFVATEQGKNAGFWLTIANVGGKLQITKIEEQYIP